jgi:formylglycine-generating enzyme required for sulfatase activity
MTESKRQLRVFLCHASADKPVVRDLYRHLVRDGVDVWMDEVRLLPGMDWKLEIPRVVQKADAIIICLSSQSVTKEGYVQKEIRFALDAADEKPDGTIYILPVRLDACEIPSRLARWQWVDLFSSDGYRKLRISLRLRAEAVGAAIPSTSRKLEVDNSHVREIPKQVESPKPERNRINFGFYGRLFAILSILILACGGLLWAGGKLIKGPDPQPSQTLLPTSTLAATITPGITLPPTLPFSPTPFQPVVFPTATFPPPIPTSTFILQPTQVILPTFTASLASTSYPTPPMTLIPAGNFQMGREGGNADESPIHTVFLDAFYIDQYEVTNRMYLFCEQSGICLPPAETASIPADYYGGTDHLDYPVINVSWEMARTYCQWRGVRLPTEAEWEKAARGGLTGMLYPWGDDTPVCAAGSKNGARFWDCQTSKEKDSNEKTQKVGTYSPNGYQLFDVTGNVWEWVSDWYDPYYYSQASSRFANPQGPPLTEERVVRGGGWKQPANGIYIANRDFAKPSLQDDEIGFRCARDANP